ncbi:hypothetical protein KQI61_07810 [Anaerocolumna aminovalerica]|uniref:hypothetical protein n=1 Tax=Anaerocolumna aminovalerica TaxID=1527 RepID=UPI001C0E913F|nr:hypothetical protein [Anaerocolumna aminovalerica]MBU5332102.1 hypothetical protein [Anaerocolumna aminovalerica]
MDEYYDEITECKDTIMNALLDNETIFKLLDNKNIEDSTDLPWTSIFPYIKIPKILDKVESYICFKVDVPSPVSEKNQYLENLHVIVYVMSHIDHVQNDSFKGTRFDNLAAEVKKTLNNIHGKWIGDLMCVSNKEDIIEKAFPCRIMVFKTKDITGAVNV